MASENSTVGCAPSVPARVPSVREYAKQGIRPVIRLFLKALKVNRLRAPVVLAWLLQSSRFTQRPLFATSAELAYLNSARIIAIPINQSTSTCRAQVFTPRRFAQPHDILREIHEDSAGDAALLFLNTLLCAKDHVLARNC